MKKFIDCLKLLLIFLKIGVTTFGGGYAMIAIMENEFVSKRGYLTNDEFMTMLTIAESTPGPLAINGATYIGYKRCGFWGALFATLGVIIPSFVIIYIISLFLDKFLSFEIVQRAFRGINCGVGVIIINAGIKLFKKCKKSVYNILFFILVTIAMIVFSLISFSFSSVFVILAGGILGIIIKLIKKDDSKLLKEEDKDGIS